jgi:hypothetical protein
MEDKGRTPGTTRALRRIRRQSHLRTPPAEERSLLFRRTPSPMEFLSPLDLQMLDFSTPDTSCSIASPIQTVVTQTPFRGSVHERLPIDALVEVFRYIYSNISTVKSLLNVRGVSRSWKAAANTLVWQSLIASPRLFDIPLSSVTIQNPEEDILCSWFRDGLNRQQTFDYVTFSLDEGRLFNRDLVKVFTEALLKCKRACIEIDLDSPPERSSNQHLGASNPSIIPLHQFLWKSNYLGIGNCIPSNFCFPWRNLRDGVPWSQLTTLYLDCPLSIDDARI